MHWQSVSGNSVIRVTNDSPYCYFGCPRLNLSLPVKAERSRANDENTTVNVLAYTYCHGGLNCLS